MRWALAILLAALLAAPAVAHDGTVHASAAEKAEHEEAPTPFPFKLGGAFELTDHLGGRRSEADPAGAHQLLFFGYAKCPGICTAVLPMMGEVRASLEERGISAQPLLVTVDPARDTPEGMAEVLAAQYPGVIGLTGTEAELAAVRKLFQVERKVMIVDPDHGPIFAHGSHIYLLSPAGEVLTLIPPILSGERATEIVASYIEG